MAQIRQEADIQAPAEKIFAAMVDLRGYDRWLATSKVFEGITDISSDPIALGTTWTERGPNGVRHGTVTQFESPTRVAFHQPMTMRPRFLGIIDITVSLTPHSLADVGSRTAGREVRDSLAAQGRPAVCGAPIPGGKRPHLARTEGLRREPR